MECHRRSSRLDAQGTGKEGSISAPGPALTKATLGAPAKKPLVSTSLPFSLAPPGLLPENCFRRLTSRTCRPPQEPKARTHHPMGSAPSEHRRGHQKCGPRSNYQSAGHQVEEDKGAKRETRLAKGCSLLKPDQTTWEFTVPVSLFAPV